MRELQQLHNFDASSVEEINRTAKMQEDLKEYQQRNTLWYKKGLFLIENPLIDSKKGIIEEDRIYCQSVYPILFLLSKDFNETVDIAIQFAKDKVKRHIDRVLKDLIKS